MQVVGGLLLFSTLFSKVYSDHARMFNTIKAVCRERNQFIPTRESFNDYLYKFQCTMDKIPNRKWCLILILVSFIESKVVLNHATFVISAGFRTAILQIGGATIAVGLLGGSTFTVMDDSNYCIHC